MIILTTTTTLEVVLDATPSAEFPWTVSYVDINTPSTFLPDGNIGVTTGNTAKTIVASPSSGTRQIKSISVTNLSNATRVVTIQIKGSSATAPCYPPITLPAGSGIQFIDTAGFTVVDTTGASRTGAVGPKGDQGNTGANSTVPGPQGPQGPIFWNKGTATINFGSFPGNSEASVVVTGLTGIASNSTILAFFAADSTSDHTVSDHLYCPLLVRLSCGTIIAGTGFTLFARCLDKMQGTFLVRYIWA